MVEFTDEFLKEKFNEYNENNFKIPLDIYSNR